MRERGGGKIVNISSGTPFRGVPFLLHYVTSKGAIVAFTRALAKELGKRRDPRQLRRARLHDVGRRQGAPGSDREAPRGVDRRPDDPARPGARGRRRRGRLPLHARPPTSSPARRSSSTAASTSTDARAHRAPGRSRDRGGNRVVYDLARDEAHFGAARVDGHALGGSSRSWAGRSRRPGRTGSCAATASTSRPAASRTGTSIPGPGIRCLLHGELTIESPDGTSHVLGPGESWFEGADRAGARDRFATEDTAFVRVLLLPAEWAGKRTIRYVDPADDDKPKLQRATILLEQRRATGG